MAQPRELGAYFMAPDYPKKILFNDFVRLARAFQQLDRTRHGEEKDSDGPVKWTDNEVNKEVYNCFAWVLGYTDRGVEPPKPAADFTAYCKCPHNKPFNGSEGC